MEVRALSVSHWCWGRGIALIFTLTQHYSIIAQALCSHSPATCALGFPGKLEQPACARTHFFACVNTVTLEVCETRFFYLFILFACINCHNHQVILGGCLRVAVQLLMCFQQLQVFLFFYFFLHVSVYLFISKFQWVFGVKIATPWFEV